MKTPGTFLAPDPAGLDAIARHLLGGGVALIPTETFYGLAADPYQPRAVERIFEYKLREEGKALPLIAADVEQVDRLAPGWRAIEAALRLSERFWPGPLSLILPASTDLSPGVAAADRSVAVRVTSNLPAAALARRCGSALIATSANRSGLPPHTSARQAWLELGASAELWVLDAGPTPGGAPSTLVDPRTDPPNVVRPGAITL